MPTWWMVAGPVAPQRGERGQAEHDRGGPTTDRFHATVVDLRRPHLDRRVGLSLREGATDKERDVTDQHPTVPTWTPEPPPATRRRLGPGLLAALIAVLLLFGGVGLYTARQVAGTAQGASSPEAAAAGTAPPATSTPRRRCSWTPTATGSPRCWPAA
jgi:hypothetical protein